MTYLTKFNWSIINNGIIYLKIRYSRPPLVINAGIKTMLINNNEGPRYGGKGPG